MSDDENKKDLVVQKPSKTAVQEVLEDVKDDLHDRETQLIMEEALQAYQDIMEVGRNVNAERSARIFEVAGQFLRTALDSSNSKADKQLKVAKLKVEAKKLKQDSDILDGLNGGKDMIADRNDLLRQILSEGKDAVVDVDAKEESEKKPSE